MITASFALDNFDDERIVTVRLKSADYVQNEALAKGDQWEIDGTIAHDDSRRLGELGDGWILNGNKTYVTNAWFGDASCIKS